MKSPFLSPTVRVSFCLYPHESDMPSAMAVGHADVESGQAATKHLTMRERLYHMFDDPGCSKLAK